MANLLVTHAHLITMRHGRYGAIADGALYVKGGHIAWLGRMSDLPRAGHDGAEVRRGGAASHGRGPGR